VANTVASRAFGVRVECRRGRAVRPSAGISSSVAARGRSPSSNPSRERQSPLSRRAGGGESVWGKRTGGPRGAVRRTFRGVALVPRVRGRRSAEHLLTSVEPDKRVLRGTATAAGVTRTYLERIMMRSARALRALAG
jgi:hypothetical protein